VIDLDLSDGSQKGGNDSQNIKPQEQNISAKEIIE
jgi:hypothetical protein